MLFKLEEVLRRPLLVVSSTQSTESLLRIGGSLRIMLNVIKKALLSQFVSIKIF